MASSGGEAAASWQPPPKQGLYDPNLERKDDIYQHLWESMFKKCFSYGNAKFETPVPITSLQLRNLGHGYWLAREWVTIQVWSTVDAVVKNTVKSQERRNGASNKNYWGTIFFFF